METTPSVLNMPPNSWIFSQPERNEAGSYFICDQMLYFGSCFICDQIAIV